MRTAFTAARDFLRREARVLEQRMFAACFEGAPPQGPLAALSAYRNGDGGFGHGLEPDKLNPESLPIDDQVALQVMDDLGVVEDVVVAGICDHLTAGAVDGAVALAGPVIEGYPRAEHWGAWAYEPALNPTAGLAGLLHRHGVDHPWRTAATTWCWSALDAGPPTDGHALGNVLVFLEHVDDRDRADELAGTVGTRLDAVDHLRLDPKDPAYGVTPLHYAPTPDSQWRGLFDDDMIDGHLDRLERDQQDDGGWALTWQPPSVASTLAYRGVVTLWALRVLHAYGRIDTT
jgi:hypothetical protein